MAKNFRKQVHKFGLWILRLFCLFFGIILFLWYEWQCFPNDERSFWTHLRCFKSLTLVKQTNLPEWMHQVRFRGHLLFHCSSTVLGIRRSSRHDWSSGSSSSCFLHVSFWVCNDVGCVALVLFEMPLLATALSVIMEDHFRLSILLKIYIAEC